MGSLFGHERRYQYEPALDLELVKILPKNTKRILDIGGGRGDKVLSVVSELGIEYSAVIYISEDAVRTKLENVDVALCANIEDRNVLEDFFQKHGPFDMVMCLDVLEHLVDPWKVIERLHYLLPEGGHIVSSIPNVQNYRGVIRVLTGTWGYKNTGLFDRTHLRYCADEDQNLPTLLDNFQFV